MQEFIRRNPHSALWVVPCLWVGVHRQHTRYCVRYGIECVHLKMSTVVSGNTTNSTLYKSIGHVSKNSFGLGLEQFYDNFTLSRL